MSQANSRTLFLGDLDNPWVQDLASGLPPWVPRFSYSGEDWPNAWPGGQRPEVAIVHRSALIEPDRDQLARLRAGAAASLTLVLVVGAHVRYQIWQRWLVEVNAILPEATARDIIGRWVEPVRRPPGVRPSLAVVSQHFETRKVLARSCRALGYACQARVGGPDDVSETCVLWDVPLLEPGWAEELELASQSRTVIALLGLASRENVTLARSRGAVACLDLPYDLADLAFVLERIRVATDPDSRRWRRETAEKLGSQPHSAKPPTASHLLRINPSG